MAKRVSEPLRNLDDSLRVFHLLTFRSCGIVLAFFSLCHGLEWQLRLWSGLLGPLSFAFELALTGGLAFVLAWVERSDDEHLVPSALRYYADRLFQKIPPGVLARRVLEGFLVYAAADTLEMAFGTGRALAGAASAVVPGFVCAAWLVTRPWPVAGPVVFSGAAMPPLGSTPLAERLR